MFYVSSKENGKYGVTDTTDNVEDFFTKNEILSIIDKSKNTIEINGVSGNNFCVVKLPSDTERLFRQGKVHFALASMLLDNECYVSIRFKSKPTRGEMCFVSNECLNVSRFNINNYNYDEGYSKSYRSGLSLDEILDVFKRFKDWTITDVKVRGY